MSKYQNYKEYNDSGVEWLGEIPKEWISIRLKHLLLESLVYGANEAAEDDNPKNPRYIRITDMNSDGTLDPNTFRSLPLHIAENYLLKDGDILLARSGATVGKSFYYKSEFGVSCFAGYLIRARPQKSKLDSKFAYWFFQSDSYWKYVSGSQIKATIQNVSAEKYGDLYLSLPLNIKEQNIVSNFLDHETAKIDTLIDKQQKLIALLKEKRQAVISHAVTKGLNPDVSMKDSSVEWLGEVPEGWVVLPLKLCVETRKGVAFKAVDFCDSGIRVVKASDIKQKTIRESEVFLPESYLIEYPKAVLYKDDLVLSTVGSTPDVKNSAVGQVGRVPESLSGSLLNQNTVVFSAKKILNQDFLFYLVQTNSYRDHLDLNAHGTANQASLNIADMLNFIISIPDSNDQKEITNYLDSKITKLEKLEVMVLSMIESLVERRTALISAAVTGKIDVRNWQNPNDAKTELSA